MTSFLPHCSSTNLTCLMSVLRESLLCPRQLSIFSVIFFQIFAGDSNLQLHVSIGFTGVPWKEDMLDRESNAFTSFTENLSNNVRVSCCILFMSYHSILIIILIRRRRRRRITRFILYYLYKILLCFLLQLKNIANGSVSEVVVHKYW